MPCGIHMRYNVADCWLTCKDLLAANQSAASENSNRVSTSGSLPYKTIITDYSCFHKDTESPKIKNHLLALFVKAISVAPNGICNQPSAPEHTSSPQSASSTLHTASSAACTAIKHKYMPDPHCKLHLRFHSTLFSTMLCSQRRPTTNRRPFTSPFYTSALSRKARRRGRAPG